MKTIKNISMRIFVNPLLFVLRKSKDFFKHSYLWITDNEYRVIITHKKNTQRLEKLEKQLSDLIEQFDRKSKESIINHERATILIQQRDLLINIRNNISTMKAHEIYSQNITCVNVESALDEIQANLRGLHNES